MVGAIHEFTAAGAIVEEDGRLLLVCNRRRSGTHDWSTPGGVIDAGDPDLLAGLAREVKEETSLLVTEWDGPLYEVTARSVDLGWVLRCEVHLAVAFEGQLVVDDPDGIVVEAGFFPLHEVGNRMEECFRWVREPLENWLAERWSSTESRRFHYDVLGTSLDSLEVINATIE